MPPKMIFIPCDNIRVLGGVVFLISGVDFDCSVVEEMNLSSLAVVLPLAGELHVLESGLKKKVFI